MKTHFANQPIKEFIAEVARACPSFWRAVSAKRYLLPVKRQGDYYSQEYLDQLLATFFVAYLAGDFGETPDPVIRASYMTGVMGIQQHRPVYFLEKELGEVLMRSRLQLDLEPSDIKWRRRQMRIMLSKDLLSVERDGQRRGLMFLDIAKATAAEHLFLPSAHEAELKIYGQASRIARGKAPSSVDVRPVFTRNGMVFSGTLWSPDPSLPGETYATIRPFEGLNLGEALRTGEHFDTSAPCDVTDDELLDQMQHLAINVLLFMQMMPLEYDVPGGTQLAPSELEQEIRKLRIENSRVIPGLYKAKFVGNLAYRPKVKRGAHIHTITGQTKAAHWVAGCWKRQAYGAGSALRKIIWIEPYATGELREKYAQP